MNPRSRGAGGAPPCPHFANLAGFGQAVASTLSDLEREQPLPGGVLVVTFGKECDCIVVSGDRPPAAMLRRLAETLLHSADLTEGKVCG